MDQTKMMDLKTQYQTILKEHVAPQFEQEGFTIHSLNRYTRAVNGTLQEFSVHGRGTKGSDHKSFTFDLSFWSDGKNTFDITADFYCRFGYISNGMDHWYYLDKGNFEQLSELVAFDIKQFAIPFFNRIKNTGIAPLKQELAEHTDRQFWPLKIRELFPGMGRDYEKEFFHIWEQVVTPALVAAGFQNIEDVLYRFPNSEVVQAFSFHSWMTRTKTFLDLEGMLSFFVKDPEAEVIPALHDPSSAWLHISSAYVITGESKHYKRYTLREYTPAQMQRLITQDLDTVLLPFFQRHTTPEAIAGTRQQIMEHKEK